MIQHVDLVHFCHTDQGYTDHPSICRELHRRYLDIAIDAVLATRAAPPERRFCWTAESSLTVNDWWQRASADRRQMLLKAVASGQLDITGLPLNQTPTLNRREWEKLLHWMPEELWQQARPSVAIQNDVNGCPRAGAVALLDRGVTRLFTGINADSGGPPMPRPSAFWWKMPDGRRMFVWLGEPYYAGYSYFDPVSWRRGPVVETCDLRYRPPRPGEILADDEASVCKAHAHFAEQLGRLETAGYAHPRLLLSITNEWRCDSDPPFPALAAFVAAWHRLGLKPTLRLTTVSDAMERLEHELGPRIPECAGEWTDWWANGVASGPREVAASRMAKRAAAAAESPLWGPLSANADAALDEIYTQLCLFDEHTWGHGHSVARPDELPILGQYNEKARYAYRALAQAQFLLAQRVRCRFVESEEGCYVTNTTRHAWSGWITMLASCLRENYRSVEDPATGAKTPIELRPGLRPYEPLRSLDECTYENTSATFADNIPDLAARFWLEGLKPGETRRLNLSLATADYTTAGRPANPTTQTDAHGWPTAATWPNMPSPLFLPGIGDFVAVSIRGFAPRWSARETLGLLDDAERARRRHELIDALAAAPASGATCEITGPTTTYTQRLNHPRLAWATRVLEVWNHEPRARVTLRFARISSESPELFYLAFPLPCAGTLPRVANGGMPFAPWEDQLPGSCRDFYALDGWVHYAAPQGHWLWVSRDAPLVSFGEHSLMARRTRAPAEPQRILAMLFDNRWYTNFVADSHGRMEFQFDLVWQPPGPFAAEEVADALVAEPPSILVPKWREDPLMVRHVYQP